MNTLIKSFFLFSLCTFNINGFKIVDENGNETNNQIKYHKNKNADELFKSSTIKRYTLMLTYKDDCISEKNDYEVIHFNDSSLAMTVQNFTETEVKTVFDYFKTDNCITNILYDPVTNEEVAEDMDSISKSFPEIDIEDTQITPMYITDKKMNIEKFYEETNYKGKGMTIHYIDGGFYNHEDIKNSVVYKEFDCKTDLNCNHGVWSLGVIGSADNGYGFRGIAPEANIILYGSHQLSDILQNAKRGDIVGASMALTLNDTADMPLFCLNSKWKIFEELLNRNVAVIVSAGNKNIDISKYELCDRNDTRPVVSTACDGVTGKKLGYSSYNYKGSMFCNWGRDVETAGSPILNDKTNGDKLYNPKYSGTSASNPINVGLFALLQGYLKENGILLSLDSLNNVFKKTGKEYSKKNVGKQIDLYAAYKYVKENVMKTV